MLKWLPHFAELVDRLTIHQLKEVFLPENKAKYVEEMALISNDIDEHIKSGELKLSADLVRAIVVLSQINTHIWYNEARVRNGDSQDLRLLQLTHGLNGIRIKAQNYILDLIGQGERKDLKIDCLAADFKDWEVSLFDE